MKLKLLVVALAGIICLGAASVEQLMVAEQTVNADVREHPTVEAPEFYEGMGVLRPAPPPTTGFLRTPSRLSSSFRQIQQSGRKPLLLLHGISGTINVRQLTYGKLAKDGVLLFDWEGGLVDGPALQSFVKQTGVREVVLGWDVSNNIDQPERLERMAAEIRGAAEYIKRGSEDCFIWIVVCYGVSNTDEWATLLQNVPFDGVALWNIHSLPAGATVSLLSAPLRWSHETFGEDVPVAFAGLYGNKAWQIHDPTPEMIEANEARIEHGIEVARELGYAAVWRQVGQIPDKIHPMFQVTPPVELIERKGR